MGAAAPHDRTPEWALFTAEHRERIMNRGAVSTVTRRQRALRSPHGANRIALETPVDDHHIDLRSIERGRDRNHASGIV